MVFMSGSKKARNAHSIINRDTLGGHKKGGLISKVGRPANLAFRLSRDAGTPGAFPIFNYGSTTKGMVGSIPIYRS